MSEHTKEKMLLDPGAFFRTPQEVLERTDLSREEKIEILRHWEYDARELQVAEEENMPGEEPTLLTQIHEALHALNAQIDTEHTPPTKHGGGMWR